MKSFGNVMYYLQHRTFHRRLFPTGHKNNFLVVKVAKCAGLNIVLQICDQHGSHPFYSHMFHSEKLQLIYNLMQYVVQDTCIFSQSTQRTRRQFSYTGNQGKGSTVSWKSFWTIAQYYFTPYNLYFNHVEHNTPT